MEIKELVKEAFNYGYNSYHECNTDLDYKQHLEDCYVSILDSEYENNNGWVKILSEEDLPNTHLDVILYDTINSITFGFWDNLQMCFKDRFGQEYKNATHYQPIEKPNPPIY